MRSHELSDVVLDFEPGMDDGPIMSSSDKREKREQILKALAAQCLPQCLPGALGLRRLYKDQSGSCKHPVFGVAVRVGPIDRPEGRQALVNRFKLPPPRRGDLEKLERLLDGLWRGRSIAR